ncbi:hypothetical protein IU459_29465 [Nocardia amamiensis]|uniref:Uncharacterized protein n=1 Tax=Nocardia amamiensis TaxID=404578 RepID=A0ABS0D0V7_9NOCA|nr:hypothetical protein [Nocardia amamiensis]MBF6301637.1 hypothetical protein [Nocardia amamiensis]
MSDPNHDTAEEFRLDPSLLAERAAVLAAAAGGASFGRWSGPDARLLGALINRRPA